MTCGPTSWGRCSDRHGGSRPNWVRYGVRKFGPGDDSGTPLEYEMAGNEFTVVQERSGGDVVLVLDGEMDMTSAPVVEAAVDEVAQNGADSLSFDLSSVGFIDSSGLRSLLLARQRFGDRNDSVTLRSPQHSTVRLLEVAGVLDHFTIEPKD
ncbi:MAG TPA: anti-sigma factor antagonist [Candidatus Microthrix parvicella]|nr:anti-sigma factor antagonist [Candidatus Microthrix parvicella]